MTASRRLDRACGAFALRGEFRGSSGYKLGPGIGLTRGSDQVILKLNTELERFVAFL